MLQPTCNKFRKFPGCLRQSDPGTKLTSSPSSPCPQMSHIPQGRMSRTPLFCTRLTLSLKMFLWYLFPQTAFDYKNTKEFVTPASVKLDKERYSSKIDGTVPREYATQLKAQVRKQRSIYLQITDYP